MKKKLLRNLSISVSAITAGGLGISSLLASCSSLNGLFNRVIDQSVFYDVYSYEVENWNPVITQTSQDITEIMSLEEPLLYSDHFGEYQGGVAKDKQDGGWEFDDTGLALTVYIRDGLGSRNQKSIEPTDDITPYRWTNKSGVVQNEKPTIKSYDGSDSFICPLGNNQGQVLPHHIYNSLRYALNPENNAEGLYMWECTNDVISEISDYIFYLKDKGWFPKGDDAAKVEDEYIARCLAGNTSGLPDPDPEAVYTLNDFKPENIFEYDDGTLQENGYYTSGWVKFHFSRPATAFAESLLGASPFCATPDFAIDYNNKAGGTAYGLAPDVMWFDGAYLPTTLQPSFTRIFDLNKIWRTKFDSTGNAIDKVNEPTIKKIVKNYASTSGVDYRRRLFESGDISYATIQPTDVQGWKKYVGDDFNNPKFKGTNLLEIPSLGSWGITTNFFHDQIKGDKDNGRTTYSGKSYSEDNDNQWKIDNYALALPSVRAFISFLFNRSYIAHYYGQSLDPNNYNPVTTPAQCLRNNYTPIGLAGVDIDGSKKDYVTYVTEAAEKSISETNKSTEFPFDPSVYAENQTNDATEGFRHDPYVGLSAWTDKDGATGVDSITTGKDQYVKAVKDGNLSAQVDAIKQKITADFNYIFGGKTWPNANIYWLQNGDYKNASGKPVADAIAEFNKDAGGIDNTPVRIIPYNSIDSNDYKSLRNNSYFSFIISGWSPDYADPYNFLNLFMYGGYLAENYQHISTLFNGSGNWSLGEGALDFNEAPSSYNQEEFNRAYLSLKDLVQKYSNDVGKIAATPSSAMSDDEKFAAYANAEYYSNHLAPLCQPLYVDPTKQLALSYVDPDTLSYNPDQTSHSSTSTGRINNMRLNEKLLNNQTYQSRRFMNKYASGQEYEDILWNSGWGTKPTLQQCIEFAELPENNKNAHWLL